MHAKVVRFLGRQRTVFGRFKDRPKTRRLTLADSPPPKRGGGATKNECIVGRDKNVGQRNCVCERSVFFQFILDVRLMDVPAGVTQEQGRTGFLIHLPSAVLALIFLARRYQPFLSLGDRDFAY